MLNSSGAITFNNGTFNIVDNGMVTLDTNDNYSFLVASGGSSSITGTTNFTYGGGSTFSNYASTNANTITLIASGNNVYLNLTAAVPEPRHLLLVCVFALAVGLAIRRRTRNAAAA
jgi:hypothetical protein